MKINFGVLDILKILHISSYHKEASLKQRMMVSRGILVLKVMMTNWVNKDC